MFCCRRYSRKGRESCGLADNVECVGEIAAPVYAVLRELREQIGSQLQAKTAPILGERQAQDHASITIPEHADNGG